MEGSYTMLHLNCKHIDNINKHMKLISEQEEDGMLPFLDTCVHV